LKRMVEENFLRVDDRERKVRSVLSKLEADLARNFIEMESHG
jgi:hypothetical protein